MAAPRKIAARGFYIPHEIVAKLAARCPNLKAADITRWTRGPKPPLTPVGTAKQGEIVPIADELKKAPAFCYSEDQVQLIHRLYHFDKQRNFDHTEYAMAANLERHRSFSLYFYRNPDCVPSTPFHEVMIDLLRMLDEYYSDIIVVKHAAALFGGNINGIALCEAYDEYDVGLFCEHFQREVHERGSCTTIQWVRMSTKEPPYYGNSGGNRMRAFVIISANNLGASTKVFELFKELKELDEVISASIVYGEAEIIALVEADDEAAMSKLIAGGLRTRAGVTGTKTFIAVHGYHYDRDGRSVTA